MKGMTYSSFRLSLRLKDIFPLIDVVFISRELQKTGYIIQQPVRLPTLVHPSQLSLNGILAIKENGYVDVNTEKNVIGYQNHDIEKVFQGFNEILDIIEKMPQYESTKVWFYEIEGNLRYDTEKDTSHGFGFKGPNVNLVQQLTSKIDEEVGFKTIKVSSKGKNPSSENFLELSIEPYIVSPRELSVILVYRLENKEKLVENGKKIIANLEKLVNSLILSRD